MDREGIIPTPATTGGPSMRHGIHGLISVVKSAAECMETA
jgi:hypothetical protein